MIHFNPTKIEYTAPLDLDKYDKMTETISKGNREYLTQLGEFGKIASQLQYNESDANYFANEIGKVQNAFDMTSYDNNGFYGVDKLVNAVNGFYSNKVIWDKIRDNATYKEFINNNINKNNKLSEDHKNYYRNNITYKSGLKTDSNGDSIIRDKDGKELGTRGWEFNAPIYDTPDYVKTFDEALKLVAEKKGKGTTITWEDANGNETTRENAAVGVFKNKVTSQYERKSMKDIYENVLNVIRATPDMMNAIVRDYDIQEWLYDNKYGSDAIPNTPITNSKGLKYNNADEYLNSIIAPLANKASYNYIFTDKDVNPAHNSRNGLGKDKAFVGTGAAPSTETSPMVNEFNTLETSTGEINILTGRIKSLLEKSGFHLRRELDDDKEWHIDLSNIHDGRTRKLIQDAIDERNNAIHDRNSLTNRITNKVDKDAVDFKNSFMPGKESPLDANNTYGKKYITKFNQIFGKGDEIRISMSDALEDEIKPYLNDWKELGLTITTEGNKDQLVLDKKTAYRLGLNVLNKIVEAENNHKGWFDFFSPKANIEIYKGGNKISDYSRKIPAVEGPDGDKISSLINGFKNDLNRADEVLKNNGLYDRGYTVGNKTSGFVDSYHEYFAKMGTEYGAKMAEAYSKSFKEQLPSILMEHDYASNTIMDDNDGIMKPIVGDAKTKVGNIIKIAAAKGLIANNAQKLVKQIYNPNSGQKESVYAITINFPNKDNSGKYEDAFEDYAGQTVSFYVGNLSVRGQELDAQGFEDYNIGENGTISPNDFNIKADKLNGLRSLPGNTHTLFRHKSSMPNMSVSSTDDDNIYTINLGNEKRPVDIRAAIEYMNITDRIKNFRLNHVEGSDFDKEETKEFNNIVKQLKAYFPNQSRNIESWLKVAINN